MDAPSEKKVLQLGWVLKKFQVGRYNLQVEVGAKTWKCVLFRVETGTKPIEIRHVLKWKSLEESSNAKRLFSTKGGNFHPSSFGYSFKPFKLIGLVKFDTR